MFGRKRKIRELEKEIKDLKFEIRNKDIVDRNLRIVLEDRRGKCRELEAIVKVYERVIQGAEKIKP